MDIDGIGRARTRRFLNPVNMRYENAIQCSSGAIDAMDYICNIWLRRKR